MAKTSPRVRRAGRPSSSVTTAPTAAAATTPSRNDAGLVDDLHRHDGGDARDRELAERELAGPSGEDEDRQRARCRRPSSCERMNADSFVGEQRDRRTTPWKQHDDRATMPKLRAGHRRRVRLVDARQRDPRPVAVVGGLARRLRRAERAARRARRATRMMSARPLVASCERTDDVEHADADAGAERHPDVLEARDRRGDQAAQHQATGRGCRARSGRAGSPRTRRWRRRCAHVRPATFVGAMPAVHAASGFGGRRADREAEPGAPQQQRETEDRRTG